MTGWIIFAGIITLVTLLMFIPVGVIICYDDDFRLRLKILFLSFGVFPSKQKNIRIRDYDIKRIRRRKKRDDAKNAKKLKKKRRISKKDNSEEESTVEKTNVFDMLRLVRILISDLKAPFFSYMKIELKKLRIIVASGDAASTALLYGAIIQGVTYLCEVLRNLTGFRVTGKDGEIAVIPDFTSEKMSAVLEVSIKFRVWQLFALALIFGISYIKNRNVNAEKNNETNKNMKIDNGGNNDGGQQAK